MARSVETTFEDELGCSSYCSDFDFNSIHIVEEEPELSTSHKELATEHLSATALYFCLSPTCTVPSKSAADHQSVCQTSKTSNTYCDDYDLFDMPVADYPMEKFPLFDAAVEPESDLERQIFSRSQPLLPRPVSSRGCAGRYQTTLWFLSNRPRDSFFILFGLLIAFIATIMLALLVFLMVMNVRGQSGLVVNSVNQWLSRVHQGIFSLLCTFTGSKADQVGLSQVTR